MKNVSRPSVVVVRRPSPVVVVRRPFRRRRPLSCPPSVRRPSRRRCRPLSVRPSKRYVYVLVWLIFKGLRPPADRKIFEKYGK